MCLFGFVVKVVMVFYEAVPFTISYMHIHLLKTNLFLERNDMEFLIAVHCQVLDFSKTNFRALLCNRLMYSRLASLALSRIVDK